VKKSKRFWLSPCCLDCSGCPIHLRTEEELDYWRKLEADLEKIRCNGCRSDPKDHHWAPDCEILHCCVYEKGFEFCSQCPDFPCQVIKDWEKQYKTHAQAVKRLLEMKEKGTEKWLSENGYL